MGDCGFLWKTESTSKLRGPFPKNLYPSSEIYTTYAMIQSTYVLSETVPFKYYKHVCGDELGKFSKMVSQLRPFLSLGMMFP